MNYREPLDTNINIKKIPSKDKDYYFVTNEGEKIQITRSSIIFNATYNDGLLIKSSIIKNAIVQMLDSRVKKEKIEDIKLQNWTYIKTTPGCMLDIKFK